MNMNELGKSISISDRYYKLYLDSKFEPLGINSSQHMLVIHICQKEGMIQEELFSYIHLDKSNITRNVKVLEEKGLIYRIKDEQDKRSMRLYPTELGKKVYPKIQKIVSEWVDMAENGLTEQECEILEKAIIRVRENCIRQFRAE